MVNVGLSLNDPITLRQLKKHEIRFLSEGDRWALN